MIYWIGRVGDDRFDLYTEQCVLLGRYTGAELVHYLGRCR